MTLQEFTDLFEEGAVDIYKRVQALKATELELKVSALSVLMEFAAMQYKQTCAFTRLFSRCILIHG